MILIGRFDPSRSICRKCATFAASGRSRTTIEPVGRRILAAVRAITQRRRPRCGRPSVARVEDHAKNEKKRLTRHWMNELKRDAARFAIDCEIGIER